MAVPITVVDSFTNRPFAGNPAGVCLLEAPAPEAWMQAVAAEVNLSETAFLVPRADGDHDLRWFTPTVEVDLCGHATLAGAHVLGGSGRFHTRSGVLTCTPGPDGTIEMDLPADPIEPISVDGWAAAFALDHDRVLSAGRAASKWVLVEVASAVDVRAAAMDRDGVLALGGSAIVTVDATADDAEPFDSVCRVFAPVGGIDEDPVTGSAHCVIGSWLAARHHRAAFRGHQASARGGRVDMVVAGDRVVVSGTAVTVSKGFLLVDPV